MAWFGWKKVFLIPPVACVALVGLAGSVRPVGGAEASGISWPQGQALPRFARPEHLDVVDLSSAPKDVQLAITTLEGVVNRTQPRIYFLNDDFKEGKTTWLRSFNVPTTTVGDPLSLVQKYRGEIRGAIVYDPTVPMSINVATTLAGLDDSIVVSPELSSTLHLPVIEDLRGRFADDMAAQQWAVDNLWPKTSHRLIVAQNPKGILNLRDYAVATRALVVWLRVGVPAEAALLERIYRDMPPDSPYVGWFQHEKGSSEPAGIRFLSEHGLYNVAADGWSNATVFSGVPAAPPRPQPLVAPPPLENKTYVMFVIGDGDNIQFLQHHLRVVWNDPARGKVPINWTINPLLLDAAPTILSYYAAHATPNDYLIASASGAGYCYPGVMPQAAFDAYIAQVAHYMHRAGLRVFHLHNGTQPLPAERAAAIDRVVAPLGIETRIARLDNHVEVTGQTPFMVSMATKNDWSGLNARLSRDWDGRSPRFVAILGGVWQQGPSDIATLAASLGPQYQVVRADQFYQLIREAYHLAPG